MNTRQYMLDMIDEYTRSVLERDRKENIPWVITEIEDQLRKAELEGRTPIRIELSKYATDALGRWWARITTRRLPDLSCGIWKYNDIPIYIDPNVYRLCARNVRVVSVWPSSKERKESMPIEAGRMRESVREELQRMAERLDQAICALDKELKRLIKDGIGDLVPDPTAAFDGQHLQNLVQGITPEVKVPVPDGFFWAHHAKLDRIAHHIEALHGLAERTNAALYGTQTKDPTEATPRDFQFPDIPTNQNPSETT